MPQGRRDIHVKVAQSIFPHPPSLCSILQYVFHL